MTKRELLIKLKGRKDYPYYCRILEIYTDNEIIPERLVNYLLNKN